MTVAALFCRNDSIYKNLPGVEVYDAQRNALNYSGKYPVVAHPPCRAWGALRHFSNPMPGEKELALFAVDTVRRVGGVLEHPKGSTLWRAAKLPRPGDVDQFGGWTLPIFQSWWGHRAEKATLLYIVGVSFKEVPDYPMTLGDSPCVVNSRIRKGGSGYRPSITKAEREHTPPDLAKWLVCLAGKCGVSE